MKTFIKKFITATALVLAVFGFGLQSASAAGSFNPDPGSFGVGFVSVASVPSSFIGDVNQMNNVAPGTVVAFNIYYHNNGNQTISNVKLRFSPQNASSSTSHTITGTVSGDGVSTITDSASVNLTSSQTLEYVQGSARWFPNQTGQTNAGGQQLTAAQEAALVGGSGMNIGSIAAGWPSQGGMVVHYRVGSTGGNNNLPSVTTQSVTGVDQDSATLRGAYVMNGVAGETWFEWGTSSGNLNNDTPTQSVGSTSGSMAYQINGLNEGTTYYYRACAQHTAGSNNGVDVCGNTFNFTTHGDNNDDDDDNNNDDISVDTLTADDIDEDSAVLRGDLNDIGSGDVTRWFEWDTNENDVEDGDGNTLTLSGETNSTGQFSRTLTGLNDDTTYYFRACAEDDNGNDDCGNVRQFSTDEDDNNNNSSDDEDRPDVTTLPAFGISSSFATLNGYYDANGSSTDVWFEWGRTASLGNSTARQGKGNNEGGMTYLFTGLSANTTYYFRAVAENNEGIDRGAILSFRTTSGGGSTTPVIVTGSGTFLRLQIENGEEFVSRGDRLDYEVQWENISGRDLENLVIEIDMPEQLVIEDTTEGKISKKDNTVVVNVGDLKRSEDGDFVITARVKSGKDGDPIVAQATAAFDHPTIEEKTQVNAIAYDSDEYDAGRSALGASLFGLFDGNLVGLLLIILLIVLVILIARKQFMDSKDKKAARSNAAPIAQNGTDANGAYRPYRPTPIQQ